MSLLDKLQAVRDRIVARVRHVNETTETDVLAAGHHVQRVVEVAQRHIARLRDVLAGPVGHQDSDLSRAIRSQSGHVLEHADKVGKAVAANAAQVAVVAAHVRSITDAARDIDRLNAAARVLSINARIEASRSYGSVVFSTIANEMQQLSKSIAKANKTVYDLAHTMASAVPELVRQNQALARVVDEYAVEARARIEAVDRRVDEQRAAVATTLAESDSALDEIVKESYAALSDLQFQDVCAQGLLQIDAWVATLAGEVAAELGIEAEIPPGIHTTVSDDDVEVNRAVAGEVMMF
jgi:hypothetical protein